MNNYISVIQKPFSENNNHVAENKPASHVNGKICSIVTEQKSFEKNSHDQDAYEEHTLSFGLPSDHAILCDHAGRNVLHQAIVYKNQLILQYIFTFNGSSSLALAVDNTGKNAFHLAGSLARTQALEVLFGNLTPQDIKKGLTAQDQNNETALQIITKKKYTHLNNLLINTFLYYRLDDLRNQFIVDFEPYHSVLEVRINILSETTLVAKNIEILREKSKLLIDYAKKIDPSKEAIEFKAMALTDWEDLQITGYTHSLAINEYLPKVVSNVYGFQSCAETRNCHGAALLASGIYSQLEHFFSPYEYHELNVKAEKISLDKIAPGDLVYLKKGLPGSIKESIQDGLHSLVYLCNDLCLSMNGEGKSLYLYSLKFVLNDYGYPEEALNLQQSDEFLDEARKNITIFRKKV